MATFSQIKLRERLHLRFDDGQRGMYNTRVWENKRNTERNPRLLVLVLLFISDALQATDRCSK